MAVMQAHVTSAGLLLLLLPLALTSLFIGLSLTAFKPRGERGWMVLRPGVGYWVAVLLGLALGFFISWVWVFVGSSRSDGAFQMRLAWWLAFLFACGSSYCGWRIVSLHRLGLQWRGEVLRWRGAEKVSMRGLASLTANRMGFARAVFRSGEQVGIDLSAYGATDLIEKLEDVNGLTPSDRVPEH